MILKKTENDQSRKNLKAISYSEKDHTQVENIPESCQPSQDAPVNSPHRQTVLCSVSMLNSSQQEE